VHPAVDPLRPERGNKRVSDIPSRVAEADKEITMKTKQTASFGCVPVMKSAPEFG
jgi:hypothetical protein